MLGRRLNSPNRSRGAHWGTRHRERNEWEFEIAAAAPRGWRAWNLIVEEQLRRSRANPKIWHVHQERRKERRRVTVWRQVPSRRNFCKDADNRAFTVKPIYDALKALGLLYDDSDAWVDRALEEVIGPDQTRIRIERAP